jgi:hypothetical protein
VPPSAGGAIASPHIRGLPEASIAGKVYLCGLSKRPTTGGVYDWGQVYFDAAGWRSYSKRSLAGCQRPTSGWVSCMTGLR